MSTLLDTSSIGVEHVPTPIDEYLRRQRELTAVERFASRAPTDLDPATAGRWRERLPTAAPAAGHQYAFEVDLDTCTGCKACVAACHSLNGLDDGESWRRVGSLHRATGDGPAEVRTVTHACHHCVEPACLAGCPANAYVKDLATGIVAHLDDDCIGCSYCTLTCPYEVPVYNASLGIVRKCDLCAGRLAEGEAPACVQGCPQGAITITTVEVAELVRIAGQDTTSSLVPGAPPSCLTVPTTRYQSAVELDPGLVAADRASVHVGEGHTPLAAMLVLTQASVGTLLATAWLRLGGRVDAATAAALTTLVLVTGLVALGASVLHLGRPLLAWRALLGLGHSWLSREVAAFGAFAAAAVADTSLVHLGASTSLTTVTLVATVAAGITGVACSIQLYAATRRRWWRWSVSGPRFVATMGVGGALATATVVVAVGHPTGTGLLSVLVPVAIGSTLLSVGAPITALRSRARRAPIADELALTTHLLRGPLRDRASFRFLLGLVGGVLLPLVALGTASQPTAGAQPALVLGIATLVALFGEYHERRLFFLGSVAPRMPGQAR